MDKNTDSGLLKRVDAFKSGPFVFSRLYDLPVIDRLAVEASVLNETVRDLPILPRLASRLREDLIRRSIFGTAAIEGNPLSEESVGRIVAGRDKTGPGRAEREIVNLARAYDGLDSFGGVKASPAVHAGPLVLTEEQVKGLHRTVTEGIEHPTNVPGQYRHHLVRVGDAEHGGVYTAPRIFEDVSKLMAEYIAWINEPEVFALDPFVRAALAHYHLALIHPFADGNGRVARLVEAHLLRGSGIDYVPVALSNYYYRHIDDYFRAFSLAEREKGHDVTPFLGFVMRGVVATFREIKEAIVYFIRKFALRDYYDFLRTEKKLKRREHDLLAILLDSPARFSLGDLFRQPTFQVLYKGVSERTARRDLKKLCEADLLICSKDSYELNFRAIG